jgi:DNA-binding GntR family transcriptional regulator
MAKRWEAQEDVEPVLRTTVQEQVYLRVKDLILSGNVKPGQPVTIPALSETLGVSHMPVREALRRLVAERALTVVSGRSLGVPALSLKRLEELVRVRVEIEGFAAEWAAENMTAEELDGSAALVAGMAEAIGQSDVTAFLRMNRDFHFGIYAATRSPVLLSTIESLWFQVSPYFSMLYPFGDYPRSNLEHAAILAALQRRDGRAARVALAEDLRGAATALRMALDQNVGTVDARP